MLDSKSGYTFSLKDVESLSPVFTLWRLCDLFFDQWNSSKYDKLRNLESVWALKFTLSYGVFNFSTTM